jgi:very-short-patch-repair endonuclease
MSDTTIVLICAGVLLVSVLLIALLLRDGAPKYQPVPIMTPNELEFFGRISKAVPDAFVFPQVAMSALIAPRDTDGKKRMAAFRKISQKRVDWAIYTKDMTLVCIVELDDRTHDPENDAMRDAMLETAGIPTVRWDSRKRPPIGEIRQTLVEISKKRDERRDRSAPARSSL